MALTDVNGTVVDQYAYDLWGKPTTVSESVPQQLRYQGYWYDNELGWYWLTSRAYDPTLERFLQPDPSEQDGLYSYAYVNDDPVDMNDPSGFAPAPIYCDSACQNQIFLNNVWPEGMSIDQFQSYGGNPDAPIISGYDAGSQQWTGDAPRGKRRPSRTNDNCLNVNPYLEERPAPGPLGSYAQYFHWFTVSGAVENYCANTAVHLRYRVDLEGSCPMPGVLGALGGATPFDETVRGTMDRDSLYPGQVILGSLFETAPQPAACYTEQRNDNGTVIGTQFQDFFVRASVQIFGQDAKNEQVFYSSQIMLTTTLPVKDNRYISWE